MDGLREEIRSLHRELVAQGVPVPEMDENPGKLPLSTEGLRKLKANLAARARSAKPVGTGKGAVSSPAVKARLQSLVKNSSKKKATKATKS